MKPSKILPTLAVLTWLSAVPVGAVPIVGFVARPGDSPVTGPVQFVTGLNEPFLVAVAVDRLAGEVLGAFDLTVLYEANAFDLDGVAFGPHLGEPDVEAFTEFDAVDNRLILRELSLLDEPGLDALQPDAAFILVVLRLVAKAEGHYGLFFVLPHYFGNAAGEPINVEFVSGTTIRVIPEPSVLWLLGMAASVTARRMSAIRTRW